MKAKDIMTSPVHTIREDATVGEAARLLAEKGISALPVLDPQGRLVGIITETDFFLHPRHYPGAEGHLFDLLGTWVSPDTLEEASKEVSERKVAEVMSRHVVTVSEETDVGEIASLMIRERLNRLPVVRNGEVVGIISRHDFVKILASTPSAET